MPRCPDLRLPMPEVRWHALVGGGAMGLYHVSTALEGLTRRGSECGGMSELH